MSCILVNWSSLYDKMVLLVFFASKLELYQIFLIHIWLEPNPDLGRQTDRFMMTKTALCIASYANTERCYEGLSMRQRAIHRQLVVTASST